ncbi:sugar phosphate isomerase/epimerase family protein [Humibacter ginsenosidimutans]|uniref:Sugar phosphate isomerase/epimerase n=1 Tax=Humibacter ginsenosidimutans TaxID=2599293 RepID=A0A5B8M4D7_9MICO|nr:sugar phosphate isomerase/epimerase family protein [Humibacter ginsenosidimutans]QDZ14460.1 sugar phosphate isomerase/epimerase [Humibacter ginsenosidimutans]
MTNRQSSAEPGLQWELSGFGDEIDADPIIQVAVLQSLGASAIEVRSAWGTNIVEMSDEQVGALRDLFRERGQTVSAIASPIGKVDVALPVDHEVARLRRAIDAAHVLETRYIRVFSFYRAPERSAEEVRDEVLVRMRALAEVAESEHVVLLHENEKEIYGDVPSRVLDIVESVGSDALRLAWDNANYVQCGVRPFSDGWAPLAPYVDYLQVKDAVRATSEVVPAGEGDGELLDTVTALRDAGYSGYASLEPHLTDFTSLGGFSGPAAFGRAARAFRALTEQIGVTLR